MAYETEFQTQFRLLTQKNRILTLFLSVLFYLVKKSVVILSSKKNYLFQWRKMVGPLINETRTLCLLLDSKQGPGREEATASHKFIIKGKREEKNKKNARICS
jgi:hypothetical protein